MLTLFTFLFSSSNPSLAFSSRAIPGLGILTDSPPKTSDLVSHLRADFASRLVWNPLFRHLGCMAWVVEFRDIHGHWLYAAVFSTLADLRSLEGAAVFQALASIDRAGDLVITIWHLTACPLLDC